MQAGQKAMEFVIPFCPAFEQIPSAELEPEGEQVTSKVVHCTTLGMRIALRRAGQSPAEEFLVHWYVSEVENDSRVVGSPEILRQKLP